MSFVSSSPLQKNNGNYMTVLQYDGSGKYFSNYFNSFRKQYGIHHQSTASYLSQQNGVAERKNKTIVEMLRNILLEKDLSKEFWADAAACASFILNRCLQRVFQRR